MKKSNKIILTIVIILFIAGAGVGVYLGLQSKEISNKEEGELESSSTELKNNNVINNANKTEDNNGKIETNIVKNENQTSNSNVHEENEAHGDVQRNYNIANEAIKEELKQKRFLAKNGIDINSKARFVKVADNTYLIHVEYEPTEENEKSTFFLVSYKNNKVIFDKQFVNKYVYDVYYDFNNAKIKTELEMKGINRTTYGDVKDGEYTEIVELMEPAEGIEIGDAPEVTGYYIQQEKKSKEDFDREKSKYENNNFVKFEENAVELNESNIDKYVK